MDMATQELTQLIKALEEATHMAKQLPTTFHPDHHHLIFSSLTSAHLSLSSFLSVHRPATSGDELMAVADGGGEEEHDSKDESMERVEEKMRECLFIRNKRLKRPLSPSVAEREGMEEGESGRGPVAGAAEFDPLGAKLRSLDLVYQFHG